MCSTRGYRAVCEAGCAERLFTDEVFAVLFHVHRSDCLVLKASCCHSTTVARKPCQGQRSDESAALGRALLFKCSKTLDIAGTP